MDSVHAGNGNIDSTELALPYRQSNQVLMNEAIARIKINKLLEAAGWRFFADGNKPPISALNQMSLSGHPISTP